MSKKARSRVFLFFSCGPQCEINVTGTITLYYICICICK